jgi:aspartate kinase
MQFERVLKFGGAALADGPGVLRACQIIEGYGGERPLVVVSAHQGVTSLLETIARSAAEGHLEADRVRIRHRSLLAQLALDSELLDRYFHELFTLLSGIRTRGRLLERERDLVLSFGERMSARIVAHALQARGVSATPVDAFDVGLTTDSNHGNAQPLSESAAAVRAALAEIAGVPVVTGFLAKDKHGNLTTLGRNGSDLTAALIAEAVGARELQLWKAVPGIMTADPELVPDARVIERLGFQEAAEYAFHGADVLHPAALAPVERADVPVRILNVNDPGARGTLLEVGASDEGPIGIAALADVMRIECSLDGDDGRGAELAKLFELLRQHRVEPISIARDARSAILLVAQGHGLDAVVATLARRAVVERGLALVAVIGRSVGYDAQLARKAFDLLSANRIEVVDARIGSRPRAQVLVIHAADLERAARALHAGLLRPAVARAQPARA